MAPPRPHQSVAADATARCSLASIRPLPRLVGRAAPALALGLLAQVTGATGAQEARLPQRVDVTTVDGAASASPAVSGTRALVVYVHDGEVAAVRSSDRGVSWSTPVRVDTDPLASYKYAGRNSGRLPLALFGPRAHTLWRDTRNGNADLCYARSFDGGQSWSSELLLPNGGAPTGSPVRDFAFGANPGPPDAVHVLFTVEPGGAGPDELYLVSSRNGGQSFQAARSVSSAGISGVDVDQLDLLVDGNRLHCAWIDDRNGADDVWYRRSLDAGVSFAGEERRLDVTAPSAGDAEDAVSIAATGNLVAVGWMEEIGGSRERALVAVSTDAGGAFSAPVIVGDYSTNLHDVDGLVLAAAEGILHAAWVDDRAGVDVVYTSRSTDGGVTWSADEELSNGYGASPRLVAINGQVVATWVGGLIAGLSDGARARASRDAGLTWSPIVEVSQNSGDVDLFEPVVDPLYDNVVGCWLADDLLAGGANNVWVGGFRPMTLTAIGWMAGPSTGRFEFSGFSGDERFVWVLGSDSRGDFRLRVGGDTRSTGLTFDTTMQFTLEYPGLFTAFLTTDGTGSTVSFPMDLSVGTTIYTMAASFGVYPQVRLGELTDVIVLSL